MRNTRRLRRQAIALIVAVCAGAVPAAVITVDDDGPADHSSIQSAINAASDFDEIVVKPGRYRETIRFLGKSITVRSEQGPLETVIFLEGETRIVEIDGNGILRGFTVTGGQRITGAGILVTGSGAPVIEDNIIEGNTAPWDSFLGPGRGAGISVEAPAEPVITRNIIRNNTAEGDGTGTAPGLGLGAGIEIGDNATAVITNNVIANNLATDTGGGVYVSYMAGITVPVVIANNTFIGNQASAGVGFGGGMSLYDDSFATIQNNVFIDNLASGMGGGVYFYPSNDNNYDYDNNDYDVNTPTNCAGLPLSKCDGGQFFLPALFIDDTAGNYRLRSDSDLLDLGLTSAGGTLDADGRPRNIDSDLDGVSAPDVGAYENQGEITRLRWPAATQLEWDGSSNTAMTFDAYQDELGALTTSTAGICLQSGIVNTQLTVNADPPAATGWFFLVGGDETVVGTLGFDSLDVERTTTLACP